MDKTNDQWSISSTKRTFFNDICGFLYKIHINNKLIYFTRLEEKYGFLEAIQLVEF